MDKDFEIEIQDESTEDKAIFQLPLNFLSVGEIETDDVKVYIKQDVYKALEKLAASDTSKELGSIILGDYCQEHGKTNVIISRYVEAKYTDASASTLTFTHETWDYIHSEHERLCPEKKIVGWQHTHPNYGIFLSNYDMFIQENFFNLPFQVAYVIDPVQNLRGFFQWKNGKIEKLKGYYIYDEPGKPVKIEQTKKVEGAPAGASKSKNVLIGLLCLAMAALLVFAFSLNRKYREQLEMQSTILSEIEQQKEALASQSLVIDSQADTISILQEQLISGIINGNGRTSAAELIEILENNDLALQNQDEILAELKAFAEGREINGNDAEFWPYTVVRGDNLYDICIRNGLDYKENIKIILEINGIKNANYIFAGQTILLPTA